MDKKFVSLKKFRLIYDYQKVRENREGFKKKLSGGGGILYNPIVPPSHPSIIHSQQCFNNNTFIQNLQYISIIKLLFNFRKQSLRAFRHSKRINRPGVLFERLLFRKFFVIKYVIKLLYV